MANLFEVDDLRIYMQLAEIDTDVATQMRRYATGWLMSATGLTSLPASIPDDLWAWGIELAAIAYHNPAGLAAEQLDDYRAQFSAERRAEILTAARGSTYNTGQNAPSYSFPEWDWSWSADSTGTVTN